MNNSKISLENSNVLLIIVIIFKIHVIIIACHYYFTLLLFSYQDTMTEFFFSLENVTSYYTRFHQTNDNTFKYV